MKKLFFFGDSVCFGQFVSPHKNFVTMISGQVSGMSEDVLVVNSSINGGTTRTALERMPYDVQSHGVDIIYIQFGMNDCNYWASDNGHPRVGERAFADNLCEIIDRSRLFGAKTVFLATNHLTLEYKRFECCPNLFYQQSNEQYNDIIRGISKQADVLIDNEKEWVRKIRGEMGYYLRDMLVDNVHPNELGHAVYFQYVWPYIKEVM